MEVEERSPVAGDMAAGDRTPDDPTVREPRTDSTVLARLDSLEEALARERRARMEAQEAAPAPAERRDVTSGDAPSRADSLAATVDSLRAAAADRRQGERDGEALRGALDAVAATFPDLLQVRETDGGTVVTLGGEAFQVASATLAPRAQRAVEQVADLLRSASQGPVLVQGHTDATGPEEANLVLSRARARTVRAILVQRSVEGSRIEAVGLGEAEPVATNETAEGRSRNRRVEIHLIGGATTFGSGQGPTWPWNHFGERTGWSATNEGGELTLPATAATHVFLETGICVRLESAAATASPDGRQAAFFPREAGSS